MTVPLLAVAGLTRRFRRGGIVFEAVADVSFDLAAGETLAMLGPSGSGKSTLARLLLRLIEPDAGEIRFDGADLLALRGAALRRRRAALQMVFQDPLAAFNPRATVGGVLADPLRIHAIVPRSERRNAVAALLRDVGLPPELAARSVGDVSGGQRQRIAIARALATRPKLIVLDEPVSALDVSTRRQVLELLVDLQLARGIAMLFITHDLAAARMVADRIAVLDRGRIVESGPAAEVLTLPRSPTAKALVAAAKPPAATPG
jgi:peptide/nickel transport system ATP-binding protein